MLETKKNQEHLNILEDLYAPDAPQSFSRSSVDHVRSFFAQPAKVQRLLSGCIIFLAVFTVGFGVWNFKQRIIRSTQHEFAGGAPTIDVTNEAGPVDLQGLSKRDTDNDGLSDYDELNVYHTSAYLDDSDSDGSTDKDEIAKGSNPVCAFERNCVAPTTSQTTVATQPTASSPLLGLGTGGQLSDDQIKQLLIESGAPADEVNAMGHADLAQVYQLIISQAQQLAAQSQGAATTQPQVAAIDQSATVNNLSLDQIRQLLRQRGVDEAVLQQVSDEQLRQMIQSTLQEQTAAQPTP